MLFIFCYLSYLETFHRIRFEGICWNFSLTFCCCGWSYMDKLKTCHFHCIGSFHLDSEELFLPDASVMKTVLCSSEDSLFILNILTVSCYVLDMSSVSVIIILLEPAGASLKLSNFWMCCSVDKEIFLLSSLLLSVF